MEVRTERGLSQDQLAEQASLDRSYVSGIERGVRNPGIKVVIRLARYFVDDRLQTSLGLRVHDVGVRRAKKVMNPLHPRWREFLKQLEGPQGCNFKENKDGPITWRCNGGRDKSFAIAIMQRMEDVAIEESLDYFETNGGHCDCEILFNLTS